MYSITQIFILTLNSNAMKLRTICLMMFILSFCLLENANGQCGDLYIEGVIDATLSGGLPKGLRLCASADIPDLSIYGIESISNGGGSNGATEFDLPAESLNAGECFWISTQTTEFNSWFGFDPCYITNVVNVNGDDAFILYCSGTAVDGYGNPNIDGSGQTWEYTDGWASASDQTQSFPFDDSEWTYSGANALDGETDNATASTPYPNTSQTCPTPVCAISSVAVANDMCIGADFVFEVSFTVANGSGNYDVIDVSNANAVLASGTSSPITVTLLGNTSTTAFDINVVDQADGSCSGAAVQVTPDNCATCTISSVAISNDACVGADFIFDVSYSASNGSGNYQVIDITNGNTVLATGTGSPISVTLSSNASDTDFDIIVEDQNDPSCASAAVTVSPMICAQNGADGINCWDLNGDGFNDLSEDINGDGMYTTLDCQGPEGPDGPVGMNGINCWDLNENGVNDPSEDSNGDGLYNVLDCRRVLNKNGIYTGDGTTPSNTTVTITDILNFDGDLAVSGSIFGLSDERLKIEKKRILNALDLLIQLHPNTYKFDTEKFSQLNLPESLQYGLLAQEVEAILPDLVSTTKFKNGEEFKSINYDALIALTIGAVKELHDKVEAQDQKIDELSNQVDRLIKILENK